MFHAIIDVFPQKMFCSCCRQSQLFQPVCTRAHSTTLTRKQTGDNLELRVAAALRGGGYSPVSRGLILTDRHGNRSEIDVVYGPAWRRGYVECKAYHGSGNSVGLEEVAKFKEVLSLNGIPLHRGLFITTSTFVPRARTTGLRTLDGKELVAWEQGLARRGLRRRAAAAAALLGLAAGACAGLAALLAPSAARQGWAEGLQGPRHPLLQWPFASPGQQGTPPLEAAAAALGRSAGAAYRRLREAWPS